METFIDHTQVIKTQSYAALAQTGEIQVAWSRVPKAMGSLMVSGTKPISSNRLTT